jgi:hypothetical protein
VATKKLSQNRGSLHRFENARREPLSETENLRHCLNVSHVENAGDFNAN